jgi:hypothetical protein
LICWSIEAFTDSNKPVPWWQIVNNYVHYLDPTCVPETLVVRDPSHMRSEDVNSLWHHWEKRSILKKKLVIFINAKKGDKRTDRAEKEEGKKKKKMDYVEILDQEELSLASSHSAKGRPVLVTPQPPSSLITPMMNVGCFYEASARRTTTLNWWMPLMIWYMPPRIHQNPRNRW